MGDDFLKTLQDSRTLPEDSYSFDVPRMFGSPGDEHINTDKLEEGGGLVLEYTCHSKVFTLWRPWMECSRCQSDMAEDLMDKTGQSTGGEYECPHVQMGAYEHTMDECMARAFPISHKEYFSIADGSRCVHVEWLVPKKTRKPNPMAPSPEPDLSAMGEPVKEKD